LTTRGPCLRHCSDAVTRVKANGGGEWVPGSDPGQGETSLENEEEVVLVTSGDDMIMGSGAVGSIEAAVSSVRRKVKRVRSNVDGEGVPSSAVEKKPVVFLGDVVIPEATVSKARMGSLSPARGRLQVLGPVATGDGSRTGTVSLAGGFLKCSSDVVGLGPEASPVAAASVGIFAVNDPSLVKGLLRRGFLLRRSSDLSGLSCGEKRLPLGLELKLGLVPDPVLEPVLVLEQDSVLGPDPGLVMDPAPVLDPVPRGGLSVEQGKEFEHVFLEMFPDSTSCSQGSDPNIPMEDGLTILQWWLLDWLRDQVKHDEAQLAYLMDMEEEACQLNKIAIPLGVVEGSELMQSKLMQVVIRALG
jgi:hypothetical protein